MKILGIESSCDETAASVVEAKDKSHVVLVSRVTATSLNLHAKTGGIIPEIAARNQIKDIIPVIYKALENAQDIDAIAVTYGPGLIGSLLVGVETAKTLSYIWKTPIIPVNHLFGHLYANFVQTQTQQFTPIQFPAIGCIVSGAHTDLVFMKSHKDIVWLGGTRDDAAGEAFDKIGRMVGIAYPAGATIENLAKKGNPKAFYFPRPLMYNKQLDFSFSGLKTAVLRIVEKQEKLSKQLIADICKCAQDAIIDVLTYKIIQAVKKYNAQSVILGGGVVANETFMQTLIQEMKKEHLPTQVFHPEKSLCTDNATMIAAAGYFHQNKKGWQDITADPELYFD